MAKGRKPAPKQIKKKDESVEIVKAETLPAAPLDAQTGKEIAMPVTVAMLSNAELCWHIIMDDQTRFSMHEVPLIESYCLAYAAMRQAMDNMTQSGDGTIQIITQQQGQQPKKNPNWAVWSEAVDKMRHLSGILGLDTLTAERLNLTRAATASIAVDLPARIRKQAQEALRDGGK